MLGVCCKGAKVVLKGSYPRVWCSGTEVDRGVYVMSIKLSKKRDLCLKSEIAYLLLSSCSSTLR